MQSQALFQTLFQDSGPVLAEHHGELYTPMKTIVERLGLDWGAQLFKLRRSRFAPYMATLVVPSVDRQEGVICLPIAKLPGWLMSIDPDTVTPLLRNAIVSLQEETSAAWANMIAGRSHS